eukprot:Selendium_serpulae@DN3327_c0_g1_i2.p1
MRGHGTYEEDGRLLAALMGVVERVNKLVYVRPLKCRYQGSVGDVIVGRVVELRAGKWVIEVGAAQRAQLQLTSVALPDGAQRRRNDADSLDLRQFFVENDVVVTEVNRVNQDGTLLLHTRNIRYGKLKNGCLIHVPPSMVPRQQQHITEIPGTSVSLVLGSNGMIWIGASSDATSEKDSINFAYRATEEQVVGVEQRTNISMLRNCLMALARHYVELDKAAILSMLARCESRGLRPRDLLRPQIANELVEELVLEQKNSK